MTTAEKVRDIIGVPNADELLTAFEDDAPHGQSARQAIHGMDGLTRHGLALIELSHAIDDMTKQSYVNAKAISDLRREHDARMRGEGGPCAHIAAMKTMYWKVFALSISAPIGIGLAVVFLVWVSKQILRGA